MAEYGILGFLYYKSFESISLPVIIGSLLFAGFDELWQSFVPGRFPSIYDVFADLIGFTIVVGTMYYFSRKRSTSTPHG
jgi:VanZ family protein